jgi:hypothetical protein
MTFHTLILLFLIIAAFALLYWGMTQLTLPPNVKTVIIVLMGLIALAFIYQTLVGGSLGFGLR